MPILQLPVFEKEADPATRTALTDEEIYARLAPPKTVVVKFGSMKVIGEFPYDGDAKPGCGSKLVVRTHRGTELAEMLTTTCGNSGCGKSVSRKDMLDYIENSGGKDYPFHTNGRVLRVATIEDLNAHSALHTEQNRALRFAREQALQLNPDMKIVDAEPILGGEVLTFYYMSEARVDFRELATKLSDEFKTRIELWQVGARDEARLTADYEKCGQHCCCKNFLKVLKPVSMRQAKQQKGTLDPLKISGRCGRLMCCLRYEDATYQELKAKLPAKGTRVGTSEGVGVVVDSKILVQLALVRLEGSLEEGGGREIAVPIEELMKPEDAPKPTPQAVTKMSGKSARRGSASGAGMAGKGISGGAGGRSMGGGERTRDERSRGEQRDEQRGDRPEIRDDRDRSGREEQRGNEPQRESDPLRGMSEDEVRRRVEQGSRERGENNQRDAQREGGREGGRTRGDRGRRRRGGRDARNDGGNDRGQESGRDGRRDEGRVADREGRRDGGRERRQEGGRQQEFRERSQRIEGEEQRTRDTGAPDQRGPGEGGERDARNERDARGGRNERGEGNDGGHRRRRRRGGRGRGRHRDRGGDRRDGGEGGSGGGHGDGSGGGSGPGNG